MFKKMLYTTTACAVMATSAIAEVQYFFQTSVGHWTISGHPGEPSQNINPACITSTTWQDGSSFLLIQDLADGEMLLELNNNEWNIEGPYNEEAGQLELTMNMYRGRGELESWTAYFVLTDKNTIQIRGMDFKKFLPGFMNKDRIVFVMPGDILNAELNLDNSTRAIGEMTKCLDAADNIEKNQSLDKFGKKAKQKGPDQGA